MPGNGPLWSLEGVAPQAAPDAWVAPTAAVIGDVILGARSSVWFGCVLRGDTNRITVGPGTNVQDGTIIHVNPPVEHACTIGADVTIGHAAIVHACTLHDRAFVGMGATVLDGAVIESDGMLAAGAVLAPGKRIGAGELWAGVPARKLRDMPGEELARNAHIALHYQDRAARFRNGLASTS
jgi:carbonic anhydrase/acetyltransferase-like protein (isoleucine patch superfamily)